MRSASADDPDRGQDDGSVTAEFAMAIPAFALALITVMVTAVAGVGYVTCIDTARTIARTVSVGEEYATPPGLAVAVDAGGGWITVTVSKQITSLLGGIEVSASATTILEH